ncbi:hypothetical protein [Marinococcus sp. PL1-022]|uniref:hypothetical protein n=1 Tax=Marinococcus sp. PL1-022 TaxID=3095363 RepID=UPI0029C57554|nr:hypothetical protein [Marinococcus sp. PL1-022]MDX6153749.1 hypothetical protein [Marinococcus sp. PL1-022]
MKKHNRSRERIEHSLKQMPRVKDKRSKNEIYHNIQDRLDSKKRHRTHRRWPVPVFTSAAVLLLAILIVPGIWWTSNQTASPSQEENAEDENKAGDSESAEQHESENTAENDTDSREDEEPEPAESGTEDAPPKIQEDTEESGEMPGGYVAALTKEEGSGGVNAVTIPFESARGAVIVPLTFVAEADLKELLSFITEEVDGNEFGLGPAMTEKVSWENAENGSLEAAVSSETTALESGQIERGIEELARYLGEKDIEVSNIPDEGSGSEEEINVRDIDENRGYYLYDVNDASYLVTGEGAGVSTTNENGSLLSLEETLAKMNEGPEISEVRAPIPGSLTVGNVEGEGESVTITLSGSLEGASGEVQQAMIDAVGLAAADFGYETIKFISENSDTLGEVPLNQRWEVPAAPNTIEWKAS